MDPLDVFYRVSSYADSWIEAIRATILLNRSDLTTAESAEGSTTTEL
ncbi:MAG: hypothetical protein R2706_12270 [Acidimicrobiales bacterium]